MQLVSVAVPRKMDMPPPLLSLAELLLTVQPLIVSVPFSLAMPPPLPYLLAEFPLTEQLVSVAVPPKQLRGRRR